MLDTCEFVASPQFYKQKRRSVRILAIVSFVGMIAVNALANILPINGVTTGAVSDAYPNLFAPAGLTFSIWGLIYLLLAIYAIYQAGFCQKSKEKNSTCDKVAPYFVASSVANILWILSWHYDLMGISVLLIATILVCLIKIADILRSEKLSSKEEFLVRLPFSIYFGWITVATIANITTYLVSLSWNGFGLSNEVWTTIVLLVGTAIGVWRMLKDRDFAYGLVLVWAYAGIYIKHTSASGFAGEYYSIIATVVSCIAVFLLAEIFLLYKTRTSQR